MRAHRRDRRAVARTARELRTQPQRRARHETGRRASLGLGGGACRLLVQLLEPQPHRTAHQRLAQQRPRRTTVAVAAQRGSQCAGRRGCPGGGCRLALTLRSREAHQLDHQVLQRREASRAPPPRGAGRLPPPILRQGAAQQRAQQPQAQLRWPLVQQQQQPRRWRAARRGSVGGAPRGLFRRGEQHIELVRRGGGARCDAPAGRGGDALQPTPQLPQHEARRRTAVALGCRGAQQRGGRERSRREHGLEPIRLVAIARLGGWCSGELPEQAKAAEQPHRCL